MQDPKADIFPAQAARAEQALQAPLDDRAGEVADLRGEDDAQLAVALLEPDLIELARVQHGLESENPRAAAAVCGGRGLFRRRVEHERGGAVGTDRVPDRGFERTI